MENLWLHNKFVNFMQTIKLTTCDTVIRMFTIIFIGNPPLELTGIQMEGIIFTKIGYIIYFGTVK